MRLSPTATPAQRQKAVAAFVAELNADRKPILIGPFRSEVGFEVSYFSAFLRWLGTQVKDMANRSAIVTRGGLAPLYRDVACQGYDLYALRDLTEVRRENLYDAEVRQKGATIKQLERTKWDDDVLADAARELNLGALYHVVHPSLMYWALAPYWEERAGLKYLSSMTDYAPLPKMLLPRGLPPKYVAVKFYARATFPYPDPVVAEFVQRTVATIAAQTPVVVLGAGSEHDDHADIEMSGDHILNLPANLQPEQNLLAQAAVISHATCFVGTYGGMAQLALRMGVPSCSFYAVWGGTSHAHYALSSWIAKAFNVPFLVGSITDAHLWRQVTSVPAHEEEVKALARYPDPADMERDLAAYRTDVAPMPAAQSLPRSEEEERRRVQAIDAILDETCGSTTVTQADAQAWMGSL